MPNTEPDAPRSESTDTDTDSGYDRTDAGYAAGPVNCYCDVQVAHYSEHTPTGCGTGTALGLVRNAHSAVEQTHFPVSTPNAEQYEPDDPVLAATLPADADPAPAGDFLFLFNCLEQNTVNLYDRLAGKAGDWQVVAATPTVDNENGQLLIRHPTFPDGMVIVVSSQPTPGYEKPFFDSNHGWYSMHVKEDGRDVVTESTVPLPEAIEQAISQANRLRHSSHRCKSDRRPLDREDVEGGRG
jgi:hypothetical protein